HSPKVLEDRSTPWNLVTPGERRGLDVVAACAAWPPDLDIGQWIREIQLEPGAIVRNVVPAAGVVGSFEPDTLNHLAAHRGAPRAWGLLDGLIDAIDAGNTVIQHTGPVDLVEDAAWP